MPNPSDAFKGTSTESETTSRTGVSQFRRRWQAERPRASALILHGYAEHSGRYEHVGSTLSAAGIEAAAHDHQGFGRSGGRRGHVDSFSVFLDDVEDHLTELRDEGRPVILLGHSMGGLIASMYAMSDRPQPDVLLLSGPAFGAVVPAWQRMIAPILGRMTPKLFIKQEFDGSLLATDPDVGHAYEHDPLRVHGSTTGFGHELFEAMKAVNELLDRLSVPTMVVHGGDDPIVPVASTEALGDHPHASRVVLEGLRHEVLNEPSWEQTMSSLIDFSDEVID